MDSVNAALVSLGMFIGHCGYGKTGTNFHGHCTGMESALHVEYELPRNWFVHAGVAHEQITGSSVVLVGVAVRF